MFFAVRAPVSGYENKFIKLSISDLFSFHLVNYCSNKTSSLIFYSCQSVSLRDELKTEDDRFPSELCECLKVQ